MPALTVDLSQFLVFLLVMIRMAGMLISNPILGRRNVPTMLNAGFAFVLAILITTSMNLEAPPEPTLLQFFPMVLKELAVGMIAGFILQMFLSILIVAGEIIDMQLGISMAKNFDPGSNSSISLTATMYNAMFVLIFFATNTHLTFISYTVQTFRITPVGVFAFNWDVAAYLPDLMSSVLMLAIKLCLPIVVIEIIVTMAVGIIMRIIPQINIFVVNIQFKLMVGFLALIILVAPLTGVLENLIILCLDQITYVWTNLAA